jgi:uncharacterized protein YbaA (DUF1428 family)
MPRYVDGFVTPLKKSRLPAYRRLARLAGKVWKEHGALAYVEAVGDDLNVAFGLPYPKLTKLKPGETVVFSYIVYKSRQHRDSVGKKVMADPRLAAMCGGKDMPFDLKRMAYGGFKVLVEY